MDGLSRLTDLEVGSFTQDVLADVQVVLRRRLTFTTPLCGRHAELPGLGKRLQVVGRHGPEREVRLVPEQPRVNHNDASAGSGEGGG